MNKNISKNKTSDYLAILGKGAIGWIPFAGPLLSEIVGEIIPNQKLGRLIKFAELLDKKLSVLDKEIVKREIQQEDCVDFFEEGLRQASRALSEERKVYIATLITNGLSEKAINYNESKHLLRILGEINDIEIIWLRFYLVPTIDGDCEFRDKHNDILKHIVATLTATPEIKDKAALQNSYIQHLVQLGLLKNTYGGGLRFDSTAEDILEVKGHEITQLGKLLLHKIGLDVNAYG